MSPSANPRCRLTVIALMSLLLVISHGWVFSSNMATRFAKTLVLSGSGSVGDNWISIPFFNPYTTAGDFCRKAGLVLENVSAGIPGATITVVNPDTGVLTLGTCGNPTADTLTLTPGWGIKVRQPNIAGARTKIYVVGSHDPNLRITVSPQRSGPVETVGYWYSVPYNSKASRYQDLCNEMGFTSRSAGGFVRVNATTGAAQVIACFTLDASWTSVVPGEAVEIISNKQRSFTPLVY